MAKTPDLPVMADEGRRLVWEAVTHSRMTLQGGKIIFPQSEEWDSLLRVAQWLSGHSGKKIKFLEAPEDLNLKQTSR